MLSKKQKRELMLEVLDIVVDHFSKDPVNYRSISNDVCRYFPSHDNPYSSGCAIGIFIPWKNKNIFKDLEGIDISNLIETSPKGTLPPWMYQVNPIFLLGLQVLHDDNRYWNEIGLSEKGNYIVEKIKSRILSGFYD